MKHRSIFEGKGFYANLSKNSRMKWLVTCLEFLERAIQDNYYYRCLQDIKEVINDKQMELKQKVDKIAYWVNFCYGVDDKKEQVKP